MKIVIGSDPRGQQAKRFLIPQLCRTGHDVEGLTDIDSTQTDTLEIAWAVGFRIAHRVCDIGILLDGNGMGMCMAANKIHGVRAAVVHDEFMAHVAREQHYCNIICIPVEMMSVNYIEQIVESFLQATVADGRYARRVEKLGRMERDLELHKDHLPTLKFTEMALSTGVPARP